MKKVNREDIEIGMSMRLDHYIDLESGKLADEINYIDLGKIYERTFVDDVESSPDRYFMLPHISYAHMRCVFFQQNIERFRQEDISKRGIDPSEEFNKYRIPYDNGLDNEVNYIAKLHHLFEQYDIEDDYNDFQDEYERKLVDEWCASNGFELQDDNKQETIERVKSWNRFSNAFLTYPDSAYLRYVFFQQNIERFKQEDILRHGIDPSEEFNNYRTLDNSGLDNEISYIAKLRNLFEQYNIENDYNDFQDEYWRKLVNEWCVSNGFELPDDNKQKTIKRVES